MKRGLMKMVAKINDDLEPEEQVLAALAGAPADEFRQYVLSAAAGVAVGTAAAGEAGPVGFIVGMKAGEQLGKKAHENAEASGLAMKGLSVLLVLTDRRLLFYRIGGLFAKPQERLAVCPRTDVAGLREGELRFFGKWVPSFIHKMTSMPTLVVKTTSGAEVSIAVSKLRRRDVTAFLQAYRDSTT